MEVFVSDEIDSPFPIPSISEYQENKLIGWKILSILNNQLAAKLVIHYVYWTIKLNFCAKRFINFEQFNLYKLFTYFEKMLKSFLTLWCVNIKFKSTFTTNHCKNVVNNTFLREKFFLLK